MLCLPPLPTSSLTSPHIATFIPTARKAGLGLGLTTPFFEDRLPQFLFTSHQSSRLSQSHLLPIPVAPSVSPMASHLLVGCIRNVFYLTFPS